MTPEHLALIADDAAIALAAAEGFSVAFYDAVFQFSPDARSMFPDDLTEQRSKLVAELAFMVEAATDFDDPDANDRFVERTKQLGSRHHGYGVTADMYDPLAVALITTMRSFVDGFDEDHENAWRRFLGMVTETMLEGQ